MSLRVQSRLGILGGGLAILWILVLLPNITYYSIITSIYEEVFTQ